MREDTAKSKENYESRWMKITNDGEDIIQCDYFGSELEAAGNYLVSCNKGVIRLLWPASRAKEIREMKTAKDVIVTMGVFCGQDGIEILFDDHSQSPYVLHTTSSAFLGFPPGDPGANRWKVTVWMWKDNSPKRVFSRCAFWRRGGTLPDMRPI